MPGGSDVMHFWAPPAGTYVFECIIPGHKEAGMVGQMIVE
jgi:uncharacterized cupredoxin-like copper-binding protein